MIGFLQAAITAQPMDTLFGSSTTIFHGFLKLLFILGALVYLIFSGLVIRQVDLMSKTIVTGSAGIFKTAVMIHFFIALLALIFFVLIL